MEAKPDFHIHITRHQYWKYIMRPSKICYCQIGQVGLTKHEQKIVFMENSTLLDMTKMETHMFWTSPLSMFVVPMRFPPSSKRLPKSGIIVLAPYYRIL